MQPSTWAERAQAAADSVNEGFGHRLAGFVPGTWIGSIARPARRIGWPWDPWHYWWQAHYLDCLVDASWRQLGTGPHNAMPETPQRTARDPSSEEPRELRLAWDLLRGIRGRNFLQYRNAFYDDMAWLALAAGRADQLTERIRHRGLRNARTAMRVLGGQLASADTADGGGGLYWNTKRIFKNTPATSPAALFFARTGERERAQALVDWLGATLFDPGQGLYLDGINLNNDGTTELMTDVWTYNQGPVLGALVALGGPANLARAEALIAAIDTHLTIGWETHDGARGRTLRGDGAGDGGLFMGILARYLTVAAVNPSLSTAARDTAKRLVLDTAEALWSGAEERPAPKDRRRGGTYWTFPQTPGHAASDEYPPGSRVELSTQLQAWMVLEFAHQLTGA
ncbi:glycoside hydrolase family 76 protein [Sinomonas puerhi]|uniref:Glycoside hydrolase family 76 protein n=1 Tax=Sinomonas puerhi TaxID=3238584 RepID=A0AB39L559_9MICC